MTRARLFPTRPAVIAPALVALVLTACLPEDDRSGSNEILETEDVGGSIDAELSTEDDPRGPRWTDSGAVLPPDFPAEVPVPAGTRVTRSGGADAEKFLVLTASAPPAALLDGWATLLQGAGWSIQRPNPNELTAARGPIAVSGSALASTRGSELTIRYRVNEPAPDAG